MKKFLDMLLLLLCLAVCAAGAEELTIVEATDLHYLSPALVEDPDLLMGIIERADGKLVHYSPEIARAFVDEMLALRPDVVVLSGDLALNGSKESHGELIALLRPLREAGIPVLALPGNHDCEAIAYRFTIYGSQPMLAARAAEFSQLYAEFGYAEARARDAVSFSYVYELRPDLWILMVDVNANGQKESVRDETMAWIESQLQAAQAAGARVISVTHQNLLEHFPLFNTGYQIANGDALLALYARYGVRLNLSGHMHLQHIAQKEGVTDIATSALSVCPNQYGVLTVDAAGMRYATRSLDVAAWARAQGSADENLLDFAAYARAFFDNTSRSKHARYFEALEISDAAKQRMMDYSLALNFAVFSGQGLKNMDHAPLALWQAYLPQAFFTTYMQSLQEVAAEDMRTWELAGE